MHWFQSTSKTFFQVLLLWQICAEFFKTNLGHKISLIPVIISAKKEPNWDLDLFVIYIKYVFVY